MPCRFVKAPNLVFQGPGDNQRLSAVSRRPRARRRAESRRAHDPAVALERTAAASRLRLPTAPEAHRRRRTCC